MTLNTSMANQFWSWRHANKASLLHTTCWNLPLCQRQALIVVSNFCDWSWPIWHSKNTKTLKWRFRYLWVNYINSCQVEPIKVKSLGWGLARGVAAAISCGGVTKENQRRSPGGGGSHTYRGPFNALTSSRSLNCILKRASNSNAYSTKHEHASVIIRYSMSWNEYFAKFPRHCFQKTPSLR